MQKCEITLQAGFPSSVCLCVFVCVGGWDGMGGGRGGKEREIAKCERYKYFEKRARRRGRKEVGREKKGLWLFLRKLLSAVNACLQELSSCLCRKNPELQVDFGTGTGEGGDIPFRFLYCDGMVVMNTLKDGSWGKEQKLHTDAFVPGQPFELQFLVLENEYQVCGPSRCGVLWLCQACHGETRGESNSDVITTDQFCFVLYF